MFSVTKSETRAQFNNRPDGEKIYYCPKGGQLKNAFDNAIKGGVVFDPEVVAMSTAFCVWSHEEL